MASNQLGIRNSNVFVPYTASTKATKWISVTDPTHITLTGTGITTSTITRAVIKAYADSLGNWHLRFNISLTKASGTGVRTSAVITFASTYAVVFKATTNLYQAVPFNSSNYGGTGYTTYNTATITIVHPSSDETGYSVLGDVELDSEPTWAAANMEGALPVDVYIPPASGSTAGLVDGNAQSFSGVKTFSNGISLGNETLSTYDEGTFTVYLSDTNSITAGVTATYVKIGKIVSINIPYAEINPTAFTTLILTTTNNATTYTWPAALTPSAIRNVFFNRYYNSTSAISTCAIASTGRVDLYYDLLGNAWPSSSVNKGYLGFTLTYVL